MRAETGAADFDHLIGAALDELDDVEDRLACGHCDAETTIWRLVDDDVTIWHITVAHDPDCRVLARKTNRQARRAAMKRTRRRGWSK